MSATNANSNANATGKACTSNAQCSSGLTAFGITLGASCCSTRALSFNGTAAAVANSYCVDAPATTQYQFWNTYSGNTNLTGDATIITSGCVSSSNYIKASISMVIFVVLSFVSLY